jgi:hypothetical protein
VAKYVSFVRDQVSFTIALYSERGTVFPSKLTRVCFTYSMCQVRASRAATRGEVSTLYKHLPNLDFVLRNGVTTEEATARRIRLLTQQVRVQHFAERFDVPVEEMAARCLDAGYAFEIACHHNTEPGLVMSPSAMADEGWDCRADHEANPQEAEAYRTEGARLCAALGIQYRGPVSHNKITPELEAAVRAFDPIGNSLSVMERFGVAHRKEEWARGTVGCNGPITDGQGCFFRLATDLDAAA